MKATLSESDKQKIRSEVVREAMPIIESKEKEPQKTNSPLLIATYKEAERCSWQKLADFSKASPNEPAATLADASFESCLPLWKIAAIHLQPSSPNLPLIEWERILRRRWQEQRQADILHIRSQIERERGSPQARKQTEAAKDPSRKWEQPI